MNNHKNAGINTEVNFDMAIADGIAMLEIENISGIPYVMDVDKEGVGENN